MERLRNEFLARYADHVVFDPPASAADRQRQARLAIAAANGEPQPTRAADAGAPAATDLEAAAAAAVSDTAVPPLVGRRSVDELLTRDPYADDDEVDMDAVGARRAPADDWDEELDLDDFAFGAADDIDGNASAAAGADGTGKGKRRKRAEVDWRDNFRPIRVDPLPARGEFDIRSVRESDYFFD